MDWDNENRLFYGGISFNRTRPTNGDAIVSAWQYDPAQPLAMDYLPTVIVGEGTPSPVFELLAGRFNDKPSLRVDDWSGSPYEGNVYFAWTLLAGGAVDIMFSRTTDHGQTFSQPIRLDQRISFSLGANIAVAPDGTVYVVWRQLRLFIPGTVDEMVFVKSTDGGKTFTDPQQVKTIVSYRRIDQLVSGGLSGECGDGPFLCTTGFVFHRTQSLPQATVDADGHVYVTWEELLAAPDNGDTYMPDGQAQVALTKSTDGRVTWSDPVSVDPQPVGHQWWPNIEYDRSTGTLALIYFDSRDDPSYSVNRPPANLDSGISVCGTPVGWVDCNVLNTFFATSTDGGASWSPTDVSSEGHQPEYELRGDGDRPFHGDYLGVDANGGLVFGVWADNRDVVPGKDIREAVQDGFDVLQCRADAAGPDTCPNAGGLNQNIYGAGLRLEAGP